MTGLRVAGIQVKLLGEKPLERFRNGTLALGAFEQAGIDAGQFGQTRSGAQDL
jgi:hypothetical protein